MKFSELRSNQRSMPDIIEINLKNPYIRPNYQYLVQRMEEGAILIVHQDLDMRTIVKNLDRKKYKYGITQQPNKTWKIFIKKGKGNVVTHIDEKYDLIFRDLHAGSKVTDKNMGDLLAIMRNYKRSFPNSKKKIMYKKEEGGYTIWLE